MTEIETTTTGNALALDDAQPFWNEHQLAALQQLGVEKATNGDLAVFHHVCQRTGLDPFARQIYMIERQGKQTIQTGIDGFRLVARRAVDRSGETLSIGSAEWCNEDGVWTDVWLRNDPPTAARVTINRGNGTFIAVALWREYAQTKRDGGLTAMWASRSAGQLAKCAEALALRKAFPQDLSGVYSEDEMARDERRQVVQQQSALGAALAEAEPEPEAAPQAITQRTRGALFALFAQKGIDEAEQLDGINHIRGTAYTSRSQLTEDDGLAVIEVLRSRPDAPVDAEVVES